MITKLAGHKTLFCGDNQILNQVFQYAQQHIDSLIT